MDILREAEIIYILFWLYKYTDMDLCIYWISNLLERKEYDAIHYLSFLIKRSSHLKFTYKKNKNVKLKLFYLV